MTKQQRHTKSDTQNPAIPTALLRPVEKVRELWSCTTQAGSTPLLIAKAAPNVALKTTGKPSVQIG